MIPGSLPRWSVVFHSWGDPLHWNRRVTVRAADEAQAKARAFSVLQYCSLFKGVFISAVQLP